MSLRVITLAVSGVAEFGGFASFRVMSPGFSCATPVLGRSARVPVAREH